MNALVIGGNRFFGKRLVSELVASGSRVTLMNRGSLEDSFGSSIERLRCDRRDSAALERALDGRSWDVVFDQVCFEAGEAREACRLFDGKVGRYVVTSSQSVYSGKPDLKESDFAAEAHRFAREVSVKEDYAEAKRQMEAAFRSDARFPFVAVRFPIVLGEDDYTERLAFHVRELLVNDPVYFPNLSARISFVDSRDAALALKALATAPLEGPVNVCSPNPIALSTLIQMIESESGQEMKLAPAPELGTISPFAIRNDWFMDVSHAENAGVKCRPLEAWLPPLIKLLVQRERKVRRG